MNSAQLKTKANKNEGSDSESNIIPCPITMITATVASHSVVQCLFIFKDTFEMGACPLFFQSHRVSFC